MLLLKVNLSLAKLLEEVEEYMIAVSNLQICLRRVEDYRNNKLARGIESSKDLFLPFSLTCSARKIKQMVIGMKEQYIQVKNDINRRIRMIDRQ